MRALRFTRVVVALAIVTGAVLPAAAQQPDPPKKYAIVIGLDQYLTPSVTPLLYAKSDATALKAVLDQQGFEPAIQLLDSDAERNKIVANLSRMAAIVRPQDTFVLYFAGHGVRSRIGRTPTYWLTWDANIAMLEVAGIRLTHLLDYVADIKAEKKVVILDHCFSGDLVTDAQALAGGGRAPDVNVTIEAPKDARPGIPTDVFTNAAPLAGSGTLVIAAARGYAYELPSKKHGVLTTALLTALTTRAADTNHDGKISAFELMEYLRTQVNALSDKKQDIQTWLAAGANPDKWIIAENLAVDTPEARTLATRYNGQLINWQLKTLLTYEEMQSGTRMLDMWVSTVGGATSLTESQQAVINNFRKNMDDATLAESARVMIAKNYISAFFAH